MADNPTVDLESGEEIDWLRHGRQNVEGADPSDVARDTDGSAMKTLLQGSGYVEGAAPDPDPSDVSDAADALQDAVNVDAEALRDVPDDALTVPNAEAVRDRVAALLSTPTDDWGHAEVADARVVASAIGALSAPDTGDDGLQRAVKWGYVDDSLDL